LPNLSFWAYHWALKISRIQSAMYEGNYYLFKRSLLNLDVEINNIL